MSALSRLLRHFIGSKAFPRGTAVPQPIDFEFHNTSERYITVILELWAEELDVKPGSKLLLKTFAGDLQTEITPKYYIIYLGGSAEVYLDDEKVLTLT